MIDERIAKLEPAFPRDHRHDGHNGMTLRDYFVAQSLIAIFAVPNADASPDKMASAAYILADAMIEARKK